ncbi:uncharacterized protein LOC116350399 [Contarinia nasturtii]|uniref:uncharacterized protein LOC116350399 n=1 Tax=Contarinia nasturtii TaxID=265458 RepID=UPI0012D3DF78|nr:uncharacterized protein LOC116350399 [Contarinia nasturtii]
MKFLLFVALLTVGVCVASPVTDTDTSEISGGALGLFGGLLKAIVNPNCYSPTTTPAPTCQPPEVGVYPNCQCPPGYTGDNEKCTTDSKIAAMKKGDQSRDKAG